MGVFGEPTDAERRVWRVRDLIRSLAVEWFGTRETRKQIGDSSMTRLVLADPLAGLRAAVQVRRVAAVQGREYALDARGAGSSWAEVASVLGFEGLDEPEVLAFEHVAERGGAAVPRWESVSWRCTTCAARVTDTGPYGSHPTDVESGHAEGCARHRADIAAWSARTGWDD
ncbi:hypothetical protein [Pseudonocardia sp. HH130629-09]|uniref:hypothetical protein n=1 Tax=Pseudonocardia sp. HH130629-09 TaxID=1641402 RepID=UPI0006CB2A0A|nr:hypothetical protein [Pseudonocardia sp. HH130629-09]ALE85844.1 hypothetical protein XF36_24110 [Pseudonocardia sp. HH130629-09]